MAADLNGQSLAIWNNLKPMIDEEIKSQTKGMVQRRKAKVTTAPSLSTGTIGVTEPFGTEYFIPFNTNLTTASVGDFVWVEFMYGATNAFASMYASADTKDYTVGGNLTVIGDEEVNGNTTINGVLDVTPRRTSAYLENRGWYRVLTFMSRNGADVAGGEAVQIEFVINRAFINGSNETHKVTLALIYNNAKFVDETSSINNKYITKIRYSTNTSGSVKFGYVDIYYDANVRNSVYIDFVVHHAAVRYQLAINASGLTGVDPSPANETVMKEYTFSENVSSQPTATRQHSATASAISGGAQGSCEIPIGIGSGWTAIGIMEVFGSGNSGLALIQYALSDQTKAMIVYQNVGSVSRTPTWYVTILYQKD